MDNVKQVNEDQFLTFYVASDLYALPVTQIKEILEHSVVTKVPLMQKCISGITNIRGNVIPIVDLGIRLGIKDEATINKRTSIIVIEREEDLKKFQVGLVVDEVHKVYNIYTKEQESTPMFGSKIRKDFIEHIGKIDSEFVPILNPVTLIDLEELSQVDEAEVI